MFAYLVVVAQQRVCMPQYVKGFVLDGHGSILSKLIFHFSPLDAIRLWSRLILVSNGYSENFPGIKRTEMKLTSFFT
jgi:hypothetical protein